MNTRYSILLFASSIAMLGGCQTLSGDRAPQSVESVESPTVARIYVSGAVKKPQAVEVPKSGLTLLQAITSAGGIQLNENEELNSVFVVLQRQSRIGMQRYHILAPLVRDEIAGAIPLQTNDMVQVRVIKNDKIFNDTEDTSVININKDSFAVVGLIEKRGRYVFKNQRVKLLSISTDEYAGKLSSSASIILLSRRSGTGLVTDHYFIPIGALSAMGKRNYLKTELQAGDLVTYTRLGQVPIVLTSFMKKLRQDTAEKVRRRLLARNRRTASRSQSSIPGWDSLKQAGSSLKERMTSLR